MPVADAAAGAGGGGRRHRTRLSGLPLVEHDVARQRTLVRYAVVKAGGG